MFSKFDSAPCKGCTDRHAGCHPECDRYKDFEVRRNAFYEERDKERQATDSTYTTKQYMAVIRKPNRRG